MDAPPPPPPPHGANNKGSRSGLPDGHYDIFVIPPHSSGSGFLYLPSLGTQRNSFLAGVACTVFAGMIWIIVIPVVKEWFTGILAGGGPSVLVLLFAVGVACWAFGKTQGEGTATGDPGGTSSGPGATAGAQNAGSTGPQPQPKPPPRPSSTWSRPNPQANGTAGASGAAKTSWEKAREETRKKEEERKKAEELKKKREELEKLRQQQREKEAKEREARERKEKLEKLEKEKAAAAAAAASAKSEPLKTPSPRKPPNPTAKTETDDDAYSFRPYDRPRRPNHKANSSASFFSASESSYAPSATTARTTPPPSHRGPYSTKDPDKIIIKGVFAFNNTFMRKPIAQLLSNQGNVTDGLILRITTEGLFIDDDVRGVPQREWDVKAWTMKLAESAELSSLHVLRAHLRDQEGKKYVFVLDQSEGWKVAVGLQRLRRGSQVRALAVSGMPLNECRALLEDLGWG